VTAIVPCLSMDGHLFYSTSGVAVHLLQASALQATLQAPVALHTSTVQASERSGAP
jgi:hypothetical protein